MVERDCQGGSRSRGRGGQQRRRSESRSDLTQANIQYVVTLLKNASIHEIRSILDDIGFRYSNASPRPSPEQIDTAVAAEARKYLSTPDGRAALDRRRAELVNAEARHYVDTTEGRKRIEKAIAQLAADAIPDNDDLMNRLCHEAARRETEAWLRSRRGKETVEALILRAIDEQIQDMARKEQDDWLRRKFREIRGGQEQA